jgi:Fur family ferric uptake transcriptional regulator
LVLLNDNNFQLQLEMRLTERKVVVTLRRYGYKLTPQRRVVIQTIASTQDHLTPAAIYERVHQDHPNIGLVTVYRTLEILAELGLICELHAGGSCRSYTVSAPGHHHHLICSNCGAVIDFTGCDLGKVEQNLSKETGFRIDGHLLEFIGLCQTCQKEAT